MYPHSSETARTKAPAPARKGTGRQQPQPQQTTPEQEAASDRDLCGAAFGTMGHLSAVRSDGSVLVFLLRPSPRSPANPDSPMVPMCLAHLPVAAQVATGVIL